MSRCRSRSVLREVRGNPVLRELGGSPVLREVGGNPVLREVGGNPVLREVGGNPVTNFSLVSQRAALFWQPLHVAGQIRQHLKRCKMKRCKTAIDAVDY